MKHLKLYVNVSLQFLLQDTQNVNDKLPVTIRISAVVSSFVSAIKNFFDTFAHVII